MTELQRIRFMAANFSVLQGLKSIPLSLLLILVIVWANSQRGPARDLSVPLLAAAGALVLSWIIVRYYRQKYGRVESAPRQKRLEYVLGVIGSLMGLAAFVLDTSYHLPFSLVGLVFVAAVIVEYLRTNLLAKGNYLLPQSIFAFFVILTASLLPLLGWKDWWLVLGLRAQLFGVLLVVGLTGVCSGLWTHWFLTRQLRRAEGS